MNYTVDVVPTLGAYKAADTCLFIQEYRIVLPARASAVDTFRCSRKSGVSGLAASSRSCLNKTCVKRHHSQELRKCGSAWSGRSVPGMRRFLGHGHERCGQAVEDDRGRGKRDDAGSGRHFKVLEPLYYSSNPLIACNSSPCELVVSAICSFETC